MTRACPILIGGPRHGERFDPQGTPPTVMLWDLQEQPYWERKPQEAVPYKELFYRRHNFVSTSPGMGPCDDLVVWVFEETPREEAAILLWNLMVSQWEEVK